MNLFEFLFKLIKLPINVFISLLIIILIFVGAIVLIPIVVFLGLLFSPILCYIWGKYF